MFWELEPELTECRWYWQKLNWKLSKIPIFISLFISSCTSWDSSSYSTFQMTNLTAAIVNGNYKNMHLNQLLRPYVHFNNKNRNVNVTMQEGTCFSESYVNVNRAEMGEFRFKSRGKRSRLRTARTNYPIAQSTTFMTLIRYKFCN